jgi:uncharacterized protein (TIGR03435 family)
MVVSKSPLKKADPSTRGMRSVGWSAPRRHRRHLHLYLRTPSNVGPPIKDALNQQLGLKLERRNRPMPVVVIDHVEETPEN